MKEESKNVLDKESNMPPGMSEILGIISNFKKPSADELAEELDDWSEETDDQPMLNVKTAYEWLMEASSRPDPKPLYDCLWNEGEVCCLFADSNLGKSLYAVQIANHIAQSEKVLYFDFELSDKQFQLRYSDDYSVCRFDDNFMRCEMNVNYFCNGNFEDAVIQNIEDTAVRLGVRVLIIDNLTWLCNASEKGDAAGILMKKLMILKARYGWSIMVIAHTPKRSLTSPITQNDLAGSKKLFNFFDSVFAIGQSAKDSALRYIKQLKVRSGQFKYDADNVITAEIVKEGVYTHFRTVGTDAERNHLKEQNEKDIESLAREIQKLQAEGLSYTEIGQALSISASKVCRVLKKVA